MPHLVEQVIQKIQRIRVGRMQVVDQEEQAGVSGGGPDEDP
jgi:hypothetical protein